MIPSLDLHDALTHMAEGLASQSITNDDQRIQSVRRRARVAAARRRAAVAGGLCAIIALVGTVVVVRPFSRLTNVAPIAPHPVAIDAMFPLYSQGGHLEWTAGPIDLQSMTRTAVGLKEQVTATWRPTLVNPRLQVRCAVPAASATANKYLWISVLRDATELYSGGCRDGSGYGTTSPLTTVELPASEGSATLTVQLDAYRPGQGSQLSYTAAEIASLVGSVGIGLYQPIPREQYQFPAQPADWSATQARDSLSMHATTTPEPQGSSASPTAPAPVIAIGDVANGNASTTSRVSLGAGAHSSVWLAEPGRVTATVDGTVWFVCESWDWDTTECAYDTPIPGGNLGAQPRTITFTADSVLADGAWAAQVTADSATAAKKS